MFWGPFELGKQDFLLDFFLASSYNGNLLQHEGSSSLTYNIFSYQLVAPMKSKQANRSSRDAASALAEALGIGNYQVGKTKIFFKNPRAVSYLFRFFGFSLTTCSSTSLRNKGRFA